VIVPSRSLYKFEVMWLIYSAVRILTWCGEKNGTATFFINLMN